MRTIFLIHLVGTAFSALAQPDDWMVRFTNPCGMPANDSVDVTGDGVPDLLIGGWSIGTDDEPSSSGSCTRYVGTLPGTTLLCGLDRTGQRVPYHFAHGDTVPALDAHIQNDLEIPRYVYTEGAIPVLEWGYGNGWRLPAKNADLEKWVFAFQTIMIDRVVHGSFSILTDVEGRSIRINTGTVVPAGEQMIIR